MSKIMTAEHKQKMKKAAELARSIPKTARNYSNALNPLKAIRKKCLDCQGGLTKAVMYCPSDGVNSTRCELWAYRFGMRPTSAAKKYGKQFVTPKDMPEPEICLDDCRPDADAASGDGAGSV